jgi:hypothetical protein
MGREKGTGDRESGNSGPPLGIRGNGDRGSGNREQGRNTAIAVGLNNG